MGHVLPVEQNAVIGTCQKDFLESHNTVAKLNLISATEMMRVLGEKKCQSSYMTLCHT